MYIMTQLPLRSMESIGQNLKIWSFARIDISDIKKNPWTLSSGRGKAGEPAQDSPGGRSLAGTLSALSHVNKISG